MAKTWREIATFYQKFAANDRRLEPMLHLVQQIEGSRYVRSLYGWTSMIDLYIAQTPLPTPFDGPRLRISVLDNYDLEFRYIDTGIEARQWRRVVKGEQAFSRLERFLDQLHWFARDRKSNA